MENNQTEKSPVNPMDYTGGYWKSLEELKFENDLIKGEFESSPLKSEDGKDEASRRDFLKLMAASMALSATACVRRPVQKIIPYAKGPEEMVIGKANYYTSTWSYAGEGYGLLVKTREGRPIKLEGNPRHPLNQGALSARASAQILSLYDPERLKAPVKVEGGATQTLTWDQLDEAVLPKLKEGGIVLLSSSLASPATKQMIGDFFQGFKGRHVTWEPLGSEVVRLGQQASFGRAVAPRLRLDKAKYMVSVDCDFLGTFGNAVENTKNFSKNRKPSAEMSKLVVFESLMSLTGMNADFRVRIKPSQQVAVVMGLAYEVVKLGASKGSSASGTLSAFANMASEIGLDPAVFSQIAKDLYANRGQSVVLAGGSAGQTAQALELQAAVNFLNAILDNDGKTIDYDKSTNVASEGSSAEMLALIEDMKAGRVKTLVIHRLNAAYLLGDVFKEAMKSVGLVIYTGDRADETGSLSHYIAPDHHDFENWGDAELQSGVFSIQQPTIRPLYDTRSLQSSLMNWAYSAELGPKRLTEPDGWYDYLRNYWKTKLTGDFEAAWVKWLQDGIIITSQREATSGARTASAAQLPKNAPASQGLELVLYEKVGLGDGASANIAWLQELPDPVTKIVWDNYIVISPKRAEALGLRPDKDEGKVLKLTVGSTSLELPAHIQPGVHDEVIGLALGYGREVGQVAKGVGYNAWKLAQLTKNGFVLSGLAVSNLEKTSNSIKLANTQGHHYMEGRPIVAEATLADYLKKESAGIKKHKIFSLWPTHEYTGYKWGMSIDLSSCTGCSACVVACQSENNIPVVGKQYVIEGRQMHWIRIDRYYNGDPANPQVVTQPMLCQHCDNAPCETVCPVLATVHSTEGTNDMAYNRCVGTRYCANNCPYKVRRFNWFNYTKVPESQKMAYNPDVTVRMRGVMEKCSFCIQRVHEAKNKARDLGRKVQDGDVQSACQQACPADAIVFGDMNDPNSKVSKLFASQRTYQVLEELNTAPSVRYMTKIRNTDALATSPGQGKGNGEAHS